MPKNSNKKSSAEEPEPKKDGEEKDPPAEEADVDDSVGSDENAEEVVEEVDTNKRKLPAGKIPKKKPRPEKITVHLGGQEIELDSESKNLAKTPNGIKFHVPASVHEGAKRKAKEDREVAERAAKVQKDLEDAADMDEIVTKPRIRFDPDADKGAASTKFLGWVRRNVLKKDIPEIDKFFDTLPESKHRIEAKLSFMELDSNKKFSVVDCMIQLERKRASMHRERAKASGEQDLQLIRQLQRSVSASEASLRFDLGLDAAASMAEKAEVQRRELEELRLQVAGLVAEKEKNRSSGASTAGPGTRKENKWPKDQVPARFIDQELPYAGWFEALEPRLRLFFDEARYFNAAFTLLEKNVQNLVLFEQQKMEAEGKEMTYEDLVVFLCSSFPSRHRERELLTRFHSLRIRRNQTIDDFMADAKSLRNQLARTSHVINDATMMAQLLIGLQPSKALSAALEAALIGTRRVDDWTLIEFETQCKALGDVHHVPLTKSKPDAVASLQSQGLSKRDAEVAAATLAAGGAGRGQWGQFRKSGQKGKGKNPKGKPGKPGKASKPDQQSDWTAGQNRWGKGQKGARSGW